MQGTSRNKSPSPLPCLGHEKYRRTRAQGTSCSFCWYCDVSVLTGYRRLSGLKTGIYFSAPGLGTSPVQVLERALGVVDDAHFLVVSSNARDKVLLFLFFFNEPVQSWGPTL